MEWITGTLRVIIGGRRGGGGGVEWGGQGLWGWSGEGGIVGVEWAGRDGVWRICGGGMGREGLEGARVCGGGVGREVEWGGGGVGRQELWGRRVEWEARSMKGRG